MIEIPGFINRPCDDDNEIVFRYGEECERALEPYEVIQDNHLCLGIIGNSKLHPEKFELTERDRQHITFRDVKTGEEKEFNYPGKSAFIIAQPDLCNRSFVHGAVRDLLRGHPGRQDHIYIVRVGNVKKAGWMPYHIPIQSTRVVNHVRLVAQTTIENKSDPTENDLVNLISALKVIPDLHG